MRTKDDAIARLDDAITWLRGYAHGSGDGYTDSLAQELGRVKDWVQKISVKAPGVADDQAQES